MEKDGEGQEGREREEEVNCHAQLKQGRQLAMAGPTLIVLERPSS